jgi:hypothetical protein
VASVGPKQRPSGLGAAGPVKVNRAEWASGDGELHSLTITV